MSDTKIKKGQLSYC